MKRATKPQAEAKPAYDVHPGVGMVQKWRAAMPETTGRTLEEWIALVKAEGPATHKARRDWLKAHHSFGTNQATWVADRCEGKETWDDDPGVNLKEAEGFVAAMYAGEKAALRPVFEAVVRAALVDLA